HRRLGRVRGELTVLLRGAHRWGKATLMARAGRRSSVDDDTVHYFIRHRLRLRIPQRHQKADVEDHAIDRMREIPTECRPGADGLARVSRDQADPHHTLAKRLPGLTRIDPTVENHPYYAPQ